MFHLVIPGMSRALAEPGFDEFPRSGGPTLDLTTMTEYRKGWPYPVAFPERRPSTTLAEVISEAGGRQLHVDLDTGTFDQATARAAHADEELAAEKEFDRTVVNDFVERAADELVGLLGSSYLAPAQAPEHSGI